MAFNGVYAVNVVTSNDYFSLNFLTSFPVLLTFPHFPKGIKNTRMYTEIKPEVSVKFSFVFKDDFPF